MRSFWQLVFEVKVPEVVHNTKTKFPSAHDMECELSKVVLIDGNVHPLQVQILLDLLFSALFQFK